MCELACCCCCCVGPGLAVYVANVGEKALDTAKALVCGPIDTAVKIGATVLCIFSESCRPESKPNSSENLELFFSGGIPRILPITYVLALSLIPGSKEIAGRWYNHGISEKFTRIIYIRAESLYHSDNAAEKHLASRLTYFFGAIAVTICKIVELAFGLYLAALSICCLGQWSELNNQAFHSLGSLDFINTLCYSLRKTISPGGIRAGPVLL